MDSTMRSNLGVGLPIDLIVVRPDTCDAEVTYRIEPGEPYFQDLRARWSAALRAAHIAIPRRPIGRKLRRSNLTRDILCGVALHLPPVNRTRRIACSRR